MRKLVTKVRGLLILAAILALLLSQTSTVQSASSIAQDRALTFITDIFELDMTKYNAKMATYSVDYPSELGGIQQEHVKYDLQASESTATAFFSFNNGTLTACSISVMTGSLLYAQPSANTLDRARGILDKYQTYTGKSDLKEMIDLLKMVEGNKNETKTLGNTLESGQTLEKFSVALHWLSAGSFQMANRYHLPQLKTRIILHNRWMQTC